MRQVKILAIYKFSASRLGRRTKAVSKRNQGALPPKDAYDKQQSKALISRWASKSPCRQRVQDFGGGWLSWN